MHLIKATLPPYVSPKVLRLKDFGSGRLLRPGHSRLFAAFVPGLLTGRLCGCDSGRWSWDGGFGVFVQFEAEVIPHDAALHISCRHREGHRVFALLQHGGVELECPLLPEALVGVVTKGIGADQPEVVRVAAVTDGSGTLPVDRHGKTVAESVDAGQSDAKRREAVFRLGHVELDGPDGFSPLAVDAPRAGL